MPAFRTVKEIMALRANRSVSAAELVSDSLDAISAQNKELNAVVRVSETALDEAHAEDQRPVDEQGPLSGVPVLIKDNILVAGKNASAGSRMLESYTSAYDATAVARLRRAGAIIVGSTNMDEFAMGSSTETSHFGATKNPWDLTRVPGGSSGGSAAAVAAGFAPMALGSDTGGSIRQPAALCGVTGLKPTYGRVSRYGLMALASSLDQIGPVTKTVEDAALVMQSIEGHDPKDATSARGVETTVPELIEKGLKGMKIGIPKEFFVEGMDPQVKTVVMHAITRLEDLGATVQDISLPHSKHALETYYIVMPSEASSNLARFDGVRYGYSSEASTLAESYKKSRGEGFGAEVKRRIMIGTYALSAGYYDAYYRKALQVRTLIKRDFDAAFEHVDLIVSPTSPSLAWPIGEKFDDPIAMYLSDIYTISANLAGIPGLSVPCGFVDGLPVGLQLLANRFEEDRLYRAGMAYQGITDWHQCDPSSL